MNWNFGFFDADTVKRAALAAGLGAGATALFPEEAEGAWQPWQKGMNYTPWMKELEHIFKNQKFTEPFQSTDMLHPSVAERMAKAEQVDVVPEQVLIPPKHLSHVYNRRVLENRYPINRLVETYGEAFGNPMAQASPQKDRLSVLTSLKKGKDTGEFFPFHLDNKNAVLHSGMMKNAEQINSTRKHGEALLEGRSKHLTGVSEKPSEAYPSFSLADKPTTIRSYSEFSDVSKASDITNIPDSSRERKAIIPLGLGAGLALTPDEAFGWGRKPFSRSGASLTLLFLLLSKNLFRFYFTHVKISPTRQRQGGIVLPPIPGSRKGGT